MTTNRIAIIVGPTACGKTAVSVRVAQALQAEIISADSMQLYRGMDIGTAKATVSERGGIPHYMLDILDIGNNSFSVAKYREQADRCIHTIRSHGKLPLVVGGTGLYVNALTYPLQFAHTPPNENLRMQLQKQEIANPGSLYLALQQQAPETAQRLHPNDTKRIVRALEILSANKEVENDFSNRQGALPPYDAVMVGLTMERALLYERIEQRVDTMLAQGLLEEVKRIHQAGYPASLPALQGIGYRQLYRFFDGMCTLDEAIADIKRETRRYAKRQWTWFKRDTRIHWFEIQGPQDVTKVASDVTAYIESALHQREGE